MAATVAGASVAAVAGASVGDDLTVPCAVAGCAGCDEGAGGASDAHADRIATIPAATVVINIPRILFILLCFRRQRCRRLSSSTGQLQVLPPLIFLPLDIHPIWYRAWICVQLCEGSFPCRRAARQLPVVDHPIPVDGHHRHLPRDPQVRQHRANGFRWNYVGVSILLNVICDGLDGFIVRNDVEV
jgi:hypothetical protein